MKELANLIQNCVKYFLEDERLSLKLGTAFFRCMIICVTYELWSPTLSKFSQDIFVMACRAGSHANSRSCTSIWMQLLMILWNRSCSGVMSILSASPGETFSFSFCSKWMVVSRQYSEVVITLVIFDISCFVYL